MDDSNRKALRRLVNSCVVTPPPSAPPSTPSSSYSLLECSPMNGSAPSLFQGMKKAAPDPILGLTLAYRADPSFYKFDLGVGAYRDDEQLPWVLPVVRKVEQALANDTSLNKEYLNIDGLPEFVAASLRLIYGADSPAIAENRIAKCQSISGTGGLRVGAEFIKRFLGEATPIYVSSPTWGNHNSIFANAGLKDVRSYRYWKPETRGLDFEGFCADLNAAPNGSVIVLHTCAHNPTGVDPTVEQWNGILEIIQNKGHIPFFDTAYQGFASGDVDKDAAPIRLAVLRGLELFTTQSFSKNFGLYGERVGCLSIVCRSAEVAEAVTSQLKIIIRPMYSNPPTSGARIVATILNDKALYDEWLVQLRVMSSRIQKMRQLLFDGLKQKGTPGTWDHIINQIGMFSFTGLSKAQSEAMISKHHIYMLSNGRISMAGLTTKAVPKLIEAIHDVVTNIPN